MSVNPLGAYEEVAVATLSGRELEATILNKASAQLQRIKDSWGAHDFEAELDQALKYNQQIWSFFQAELSSDENPLPVDIKKNLLTLSVFVDKRTFEIMAYPAPEKLDILININRNLAAGLLSNAG